MVIVSDLFCVLGLFSTTDVVCHVNSCVCIKLEESFYLLVGPSSSQRYDAVTLGRDL